MENCEVQLNFKPTDVKMTQIIDMKYRSSGSFLVVGHTMWSTASYMSPNGKMIRDVYLKMGLVYCRSPFGVIQPKRLLITKHVIN